MTTFLHISILFAIAMLFPLAKRMDDRIHYRRYGRLPGVTLH